MDQIFQQYLQELLSGQAAANSASSPYYRKQERRRQEPVRYSYPYGGGYSRYPARRSYQQSVPVYPVPFGAPVPQYLPKQYLVPQYYYGEDEDQEADEDAESSAVPAASTSYDQEPETDANDVQYRTLDDVLGPYFTRRLARQPRQYAEAEAQNEEADESDPIKALIMDALRRQGVEKEAEKRTEDEELEDEAAKPLASTENDNAESLDTPHSTPFDSSKSGVNVAQPPALAPAQTPAKPSSKPKLRRKSTASLNVHSKQGPEIKIDPLQISAPQLKTSLPFSPAVNVYDFPENYVIVVALPGVSKEFVDVDYHPSSSELVIKGEVNNKYLSDDPNVDNTRILKVSEQRFGSFERVVKLPSFPDVKEEDISAKFKLGMLEIKVPKLKESEVVKKPRKISLEEVPDEEIERESKTDYI